MGRHCCNEKLCAKEIKTCKLTAVKEIDASGADVTVKNLTVMGDNNQGGSVSLHTLRVTESAQLPGMIFSSGTVSTTSNSSGPLSANTVISTGTLVAGTLTNGSLSSNKVVIAPPPEEDGDLEALNSSDSSDSTSTDSSDDLVVKRCARIKKCLKVEKNATFHDNVHIKGDLRIDGRILVRCGVDECGDDECADCDSECIEEGNCTHDLDWWIARDLSLWPASAFPMTVGGVVYATPASALAVLTNPSTQTPYEVAREIIVVNLNVASGADPSEVALDLVSANDWLVLYPLGTNPDGQARKTGRELRDSLRCYNKGATGPGACKGPAPHRYLVLQGDCHEGESPVVHNPRPGPLAFDGTHLWTVVEGGLLRKLTVSSGTSTTVVVAGATAVGDLLFASGSLWVSATIGGQRKVVQLDLNGNLLATY